MARRNLLSQTEAQSRLVQQISQTIRDHQGGTVSASALFPFTWERLCIFTWADKLSSVNPALGVEWVVPDDQMIGSGEGYTLPDYQIAVFVESGSVVQHLIFPEYPLPRLSGQHRIWWRLCSEPPQPSFHGQQRNNCDFSCTRVTSTSRGKFSRASVHS